MHLLVFSNESIQFIAVRSSKNGEIFNFVYLCRCAQSTTNQTVTSVNAATVIFYDHIPLLRNVSLFCTFYWLTVLQPFN